jgi:hypothetical protein
VLHDRCGCDPEDAAQFETEQDATVYARETLAAFWPYLLPRTTATPARTAAAAP